MAKKPKATYPIVVDVSQSGAFTYSVEGNPQADATFLMVQPDESVSWLVRHGRRKIPVPFQIEFGVFNPMNMNETVIRSRGERTKPVLVNLDADYIGNLAFKYTISTLNGWWDDPDIVPVPSDGVKKAVRRAVTTPTVTLSPDTDAGGKRIVDCSPPDESVGAGVVAWAWASNTAKPDDFVLTFDNNAGYFPGPTGSKSQAVYLNFPPTKQDQTSVYRVKTLTLGVEGSGTLTITASSKRKRRTRRN